MMIATRLAAVLLVLVLVLLVLPASGSATTYHANPTNLDAQMRKLALPGDSLILDPGQYLNTGILLYNVSGTAALPIVVTGPASGTPATIYAPNPYTNTIQLDNASYVTIQHLVVNGTNGVGDTLSVDGVNAKGHPCHHITVDDLKFYAFQSFDRDQSIVGISTKTECWNWTIKNCFIHDAGTGIYLGNSDGSCPFIAGLLDHNLVMNTLGYDIEIKYQIPYAYLPGMPTAPSTTIIRNNVFIKSDDYLQGLERPNLLVDQFPSSGQGSSDHYEIYGNLIVHNPSEALIQASGRVSIHDNILVDPDPTYAALYLTDHDGILQKADVYNNTVYAGAQGIVFNTQPREGGALVGNLVFATTPISAAPGVVIPGQRDNVGDSPANAGLYVNAPSKILGQMDFYPRSTCATCSGSPLDLSAFAAQLDFDRDFNGTSKGQALFRGAYQGSGANPGWPLGAGIKIGGPSGGPGSGGDTTPPSAVEDLHTR